MRIVLASIAAVSLAAALGGCSNSEDSSTPESAPASATADATNQDNSPTASGPADGAKTTDENADLADHEFATSAQDAVDKAQQEAGNGTVHAIEIDYSQRDHAWIWVVKTLVGKDDHKVKINADTGEVVRTEKDSTNDREEAIDLNKPMTFNDAKKKALEKRQGRISEWKYEWDDGRKEFQFNIDKDGQDKEVTVDADSGQVTVDD